MTVYFELAFCQVNAVRCGLFLHNRLHRSNRYIRSATCGKYLRKCAPSEDSDQTAHSRSLIRIFTGRIWIANDAKFLRAETENSN